jgi:predicted RNase H-like nuclease (RuvC/YqgF family)
MKPMNWVFVLVIVAVVIAVALVFTGQKHDTPQGQHADSVLAQEPAFRDSMQARDSVIHALVDTITKVKHERGKWRDSVETLKNRADSLQEQATVVEASLAPWMTPHDSITTLHQALERQKQVSGALRNTVVALERAATLDSITIHLADSTIQRQLIDHNILLARLDTVTTTLSDLRDATKPGPSIRLPLVGRIPARDIVIALGSYCIGGGTPC